MAAERVASGFLGGAADQGAYLGMAARAAGNVRLAAGGPAQNGAAAAADFWRRDAADGGFWLCRFDRPDVGRLPFAGRSGGGLGVRTGIVTLTAALAGRGPG